MFTANDFNEDESASCKTIVSKCLTNSIASFDASEERLWDLCGASLCDVHVSAIVKALEDNTKILSLDLSDNCFTETGLTKIAKMMETNSNIMSVYFSGAFVSSVEQDRHHSKRVHTITCRLIDYSNIVCFTCCCRFMCGMLAGNNVDDGKSAAIQAIQLKCKENKVSRACIQLNSNRTQGVPKGDKKVLPTLLPALLPG